MKGEKQDWEHRLHPSLYVKCLWNTGMGEVDIPSIIFFFPISLLLTSNNSYYDGSMAAAMIPLVQHQARIIPERSGSMRKRVWLASRSSPAQKRKRQRRYPILLLNSSLASHTHFHILRFAQGKGSGQRSIPSLFPTPGFWRANQISSLKMT